MDRLVQFSLSLVVIVSVGLYTLGWAWSDLGSASAYALLFGIPVLSFLSFKLYAGIKLHFEKCRHGIYVNRVGIDCQACIYDELEARRMHDMKLAEARRIREEKEAIARRLQDRIDEEKRIERERREAEARQRVKAAVKRIHDLEHLRKLPPLVFEEFVLTLFRKLGYDAKPTPASGDDGIDGILCKPNGAKGGLQCKRYREKISPRLVREFVGSLVSGDLSFGIFVTTSEYSPNARDWVKGISHTKSVELVDGYGLIDLVNAAFTDSDEVAARFGFPQSGDSESDCPECGGCTRIVDGRYGPFIGCANYPRCRWTRDLGSRQMTTRRKRRKRWRR